MFRYGLEHEFRNRLGYRLELGYGLMVCVRVRVRVNGMRYDLGYV